jgi:putative FmdB family regulatory protein
MPEYTYICNKCNKKFVLVCTISKYNEHANCEYCNSNDTERSYRDDLLGLNTAVKLADNELKTIGDLANRNSERMTEDHKHSLHEKHNAYRDKEEMKALPKGMSRMQKPTQRIKWT